MEGTLGKRIPNLKVGVHGWKEESTGRKERRNPDHIERKGMTQEKTSKYKIEKCIKEDKIPVITGLYLTSRLGKFIKIRIR